MNKSVSETSPHVQEMEAFNANNYSFKIMTWNVWFDILEIQNRMAYIIDQVLRILPDVACFQEVVPTFAEMLRKSRLLKEQHYTISPYEPLHNYGNITIVRHKATTFRILDFPNSKMGRKLTLATFKINKVPSIPEITVGNVHLESLNNRSKRVEQQMIICRDNLPSGSSILTGDFNISANDGFYRERMKKVAAESAK